MADTRKGVERLLYLIPKVDTENVERGSRLQINTLFRGNYLFVEDDDLLKEDVFAGKNNNKTLLKALFIRELFPFLLIIDCYIKNLSALFFLF